MENLSQLAERDSKKMLKEKMERKVNLNIIFNEVFIIGDFMV